MNLKRIIRGVKNELRFEPKNLLLEKNNLDCLEEILAKETKNLCPRTEFEQIKQEKKKYSPEELYSMLIESKQFADAYFGKEDTSKLPTINYFSMRKLNLTTIPIYTYYISTLFNVAAIVPLMMEKPVAGFMCMAVTPFFGLAAYLSHDFAKSAGYEFLRNNINVEPASEYRIRGIILHEYIHHYLRENKILVPKIEEGFARGMDRMYSMHLTKSNNDERYAYWTLWQSYEEINNAYRWACNKIGRKTHAFNQLGCEPEGDANSYTVGGALFRLAEEQEGQDAYRNFLTSYCVSNALSNIND